MTENRSPYSHRSADPYDPPSTDSPSAIVEAAGKVGDDVIAILTDGLRVVRSDRQWIVQQRNAKTWSSFAYCATKEGLLVRIKDHLLKEHLIKLGHHQVKQVKALDEKLPASGSRPKRGL